MAGYHEFLDTTNADDLLFKPDDAPGQVHVVPITQMPANLVEENSAAQYFSFSILGDQATDDFFATQL
jgi:hypothetical protein